MAEFSNRFGLPHKNALSLVTFIALILSLTTDLHADRITLTSGKVLEGKIVEDGDPVTIDLAGGRVKIARNQIASIEIAPTAQELLAVKEASLEDGNTQDLAQLARWCEENRLLKERDRFYWRILEIDRNHRGARDALGFKKLGALWLTEADWHHHHGRLKWNGEWISQEEWHRREEERIGLLERSDAIGMIESASKKGIKPEQSKAVIAEFRQLPESLRRYTLAKSLDSRSARQRQLAIRLTGELSGNRPQWSVSHLAVHDPRKSVRDEALRLLLAWNEPDTALAFIPYLRSANDRDRVNAARALNLFPDRRAVPALIETAHLIWAGFGRTHFANLVQRSFVQDYELVSGGTGLVVSEVADPVVDTFIEGVVLDVEVRRAEAFARIATLERTTGQSFGGDFEAWAQWWKEEQGKPSKSIPETGSEPASGDGR